MNIFKTILLVVITTFSSSSYGQAKQVKNNDFTLEVDVSSMQPVPEKLIFMVFTNKPDGMQAESDSTFVENGKAVFKGKINEPTLALLQTKFFGEPGKFILTNGKVKVKLGKEITQLQVENSKYQQDYEKLMQKKLIFDSKLLALEEGYKKEGDSKDQAKVAAYNKQFMEILDQSNNEVWRDYIVQNGKKSALSLFALFMYNQSGPKDIEDVYNMLAPEFKKMPTAKFVKDKIDLDKRQKIGALAPVFTQKDINGKDVQLESFRGKYLLLDFWASWCHPCREENPSLIKAYKEFNDKNFTILSVSLDSEKTKQAWLKAIEDDKVGAWTHVSDLLGWENAAAALYGIKAVPQNYLIDPTGKIIASGLTGDQLYKKLEEILGKNKTE